MIPNGLFTQIGAMIISVGIIFTYIEPSFAEVKLLQDDIARYQKEREGVLAVNSLLSSLVTKMENVSPTDRQRLLAYMPNEVDELYVSRDLQIMAQKAGVLYRDVKYLGKEEEKKPSRNTPNQVVAVGSNPHIFSLSAEGTYEQIKALFDLIAKNKYPLEVHRLAIKQTEGGFLSVDTDLVTYSYRDNGFTSEEIVF
ncbi:MAG: hypothetical protein RL097_682 [Candidatus Parcubacteria bacterium]|jgi:hypothetical protein